HGRVYYGDILAWPAEEDAVPVVTLAILRVEIVHQQHRAGVEENGDAGDADKLDPAACLPAAAIDAKRKVKHAAFVLGYGLRALEQGRLVVGEPITHRSEGADVEALWLVLSGEERAGQHQDEVNSRFQ